MNDLEENRFDKGIAEWNPSLVTLEQPLWKTYKQTPSKEFGGIYEPYIFTEGKRLELEKLPSLDIVAPPGFSISQEIFKPAWDRLIQIHEIDLHEAQIRGAREVSKEIFHELDVDLITATSGRETWSMIASDRPMSEMVEFARNDISIGDYQRRSMLSENGLSIWRIIDNGKETFAVGEGQHHMATYKILSFMGCQVKFRNIEVGTLEY